MSVSRTIPATPPSASARLFSIAAVLLFFTLLAGPVSFWDSGHGALLSLRHGLVSCAVFTAAGAALCVARKITFTFNLFAWCGIVFLFLFSDWLTRSYNFFQGPSIRGELLLGALTMYSLIATRRTRWLKLLFPLTVLIDVCALQSHVAGKLIFSDDLTTFLYRLQLLKENFPHIPFYNPQWNGGIDQRDFFATGALNIFLLLSPIIYTCNIFSCFNLLVMLLLFGIAPLSTYAAAKILRQSTLVASVAATLIMTSGLLWYRWALAYGTLGFAVSAALFPLVLAITSLVIEPEARISKRMAALLCISFTLMLFWSPSGLAFLPVAGIAIVFARTALSKKHVLASAALMLAVNVPWLIVFVSVSKVGSFITTEKYQKMPTRDVEEVTANNATEPVSVAPLQTVGKPGANQSHAKAGHGLTLLREAAISTNPFLIILGLPGVLLFSGRKRLLYAGTSLWLLLLGTVVAPYKPQLELDRMLLLLAMVGAIPAAFAFECLLERTFDASHAFVKRVTVASLGSFLLVGPFAAGAVLSGRSLVQYFVAGGVVHDLPSAITEFGGDGRVLFSGFVLHELGGGHLAPLALMTDKPLMASSHVHDMWRYRQIVPREFLVQGEEGIQKYFDLYNVTAVIAHEKKWYRLFEDRPQHFARVWANGRFSLFKRLDIHPSYFVAGAGTILKQTSHSVELSLTTADAVIKFNYYPFLEARGCTVSPSEQSESVTFIRLSGCPLNTPITIQSEGVLRRL